MARAHSRKIVIMIFFWRKEDEDKRRQKKWPKLDFIFLPKFPFLNIY